MRVNEFRAQRCNQIICVGCCQLYATCVLYSCGMMKLLQLLQRLLLLLLLFGSTMGQSHVRLVQAKLHWRALSADIPLRPWTAAVAIFGVRLFCLRLLFVMPIPNVISI